MMPSDLQEIVTEIRACRICAGSLVDGINPVLRISATARICIAGQAPGRRVHQTGTPYGDRSGDRLRDNPVKRAINRDAPRTYADTPLIEAIRLLCRNHLTIPVVERDTERLIGIISYWDAAAYITGLRADAGT